MPDIVDAATRSRMMAGIRSRNTRPEIAVRKALHAAGFRYRLHVRGLPGRPDIVFPSCRAVIFVNGCFWHGHGCSLFRLPGTRKEFWRAKIDHNRHRDEEVRRELRSAGWRCLTIWECSLRGKDTLGLTTIVAEAKNWLLNRLDDFELSSEFRPR